MAHTKNSNLLHWQRFCQYQPTRKLVRLVFCWWLLVVAITTIKLSRGFGLSIVNDLTGNLSDMMDTALDFSIILLVLICVIALIDVLLLVGLSQKQHFTIQRNYPNNVAIFHVFQVEVTLELLTSSLGKLTTWLSRLFNIKHVNIEFDDEYPQQLKLVSDIQASPDASAKTEKANSLPLTLSMPLQDKASLSKQSEQSIAKKRISKKISYPVIPTERGTGFFGECYLRVASPLGWFNRRLQITEVDTAAQKHNRDAQSETGIDNRINEQKLDNQIDVDTSVSMPNASSQPTANSLAYKKYIRVLADFSGLLNNQFAAVYEKNFDIGNLSIKEQGSGSEFLKLREYIAGDTMRQIDWKASSRQNRLMSKSYEDENDQDVVFLLDCSEQMRHKISMASLDSRQQSNSQSKSQASLQLDLQLSYFDQVLNSVLLLSYVANKQGDRVGLQTFGGINDGKELYIAPTKGTALIRHLLNETADIQPSMQTSDYLQAAQQLKKSLKKRSLIVLITNTRQEANAELVEAVKTLSRQHQLIFANLTEQSVQDILNQQQIPISHDDALLYHALSEYQKMRAKMHKKLTQQTSTHCIDTTASQLPHRLIQAYQTFKG